MRTALVATLLATICTAPGAIVAEQAGGTTSGLADVSAARIRAAVEFLASDLLEGRKSGTRGYDVAALYAASQLAAAGWEPAADDGSYLQQVPLRESSLVSSSLSLRSAGGGEPVAIPIPAEGIVPAGDERVSVTAPVVFAGYGVSAPAYKHDDYAGLDVTGTIVAVLWNAPATFPSEPRAHYASMEQKLRTAAERGAVGLIFVLPASPNLPWPAVQAVFGLPLLTWTQADGSPGTSDSRIKTTVVMNSQGASRLFAGSTTTFEQAYAAAEKGTAGGAALKTVLTVDAVAKHRRLTSPNVVARLRGSDPALASSSVLMTAHLDHTGVLTAGDGDRVHNGAYDNAVGSAIVLDVARALANAPGPRRSVVVALVTAEESGLVGSDYLARHQPKAAGEVVANVNLDMPLFLTASRDLVAFGAENSTLDVVVRDVAKELDYTLSPDPMPNQNLFIRSDQYSFVKQGVPAVYLMPGFAAADAGVNGQQLFGDFMARHYHKPSDDLSQPMHAAAMERFARANLRLVQRIADATQAPTWKPGNFFGRTFGR